MNTTTLRTSFASAVIAFVLGIGGVIYCWAEGQKFSDSDVCRAAIGAIMGRDPTTIKITQVKDGIYYLTYTRPSDGTKWSQRCKIEGNQVIWASDEPGKTGRWRTHPADEKISFEAVQNGSVLRIRQQFPDGSSTSKDFTRNCSTPRGR